jgi:DNA-binding CsgD family transcriptional regulator
VALFALKGCTAQDIARIRSTAEGTVRAQLTRIYAKAGVASQAGLVSLFFDDLLDVDTLKL